MRARCYRRGLDDDELVRRFRAGDRVAFAEICRRYWGLVGRFFATKLEAQVDDLRQTTFERLMGALERFEGRSTLRGFILGIAHKVLLESLRGKYREEREDIAELSVADLGLSPGSLLGHQAEQRRLLHALRRVPIIFQVVLELTYWENSSDREIGEVLGLPANTVRGRRVRARERLRAELERGPDDPDGAPPVLTETPADFEAWAQRIGRELWHERPEPEPPE